MRVDVIMPVGPGEQKYISTALSSTLAACGDDSTVIIVLDGRTDLPETLKDPLDSRCQVIVNRGVRGIGGAMNAGLSLSTAEFVAVMHADDVMQPQRLTRQVAILAAHTDIGALGSTAVPIYDEDNPSAVFFSEPVRGSLHRVSTRSLLRANPLVDPSTTFRRSALVKVGEYTSGLTSMQDYEVLLKIGASFDVALLDEPLIAYRQHSGQFSRRRRSWTEWRALGIQRRNLSRRRLGGTIPGLAWHLRDLLSHAHKSLMFRGANVIRDIRVSRSVGA